MVDKSKYQLYSYILVFFSILILFLFTKTLYFSLVENNQQAVTLEQTITEKNQEYDRLTNIKADINKPENKSLGLSKYIIKFSEDELIEYFYSYATMNAGKVKIESLNFQEGKPNEFGLNEGNVELSATFISEQDMMNMINFLLNSDKYNFYIHSFDYPLGEETVSPIKVSIPLKILYK